MSGEAGKGDKWRKTNFRKYQENWPLGGPQREIHKKLKPYQTGLRCEYHNFVNGECSSCGLPAPLTKAEAIRAAISGDIGLFPFKL